MTNVSAAVRLLVALCVWGLAREATAGPEAFWIGVGTHFGQSRGSPQQSFGRMIEAGVAAFRDEIFWRDVETVQGRLELSSATKRVEEAIERARAAHIEPVIILCYGNPFYGGGLPMDDGARAGFARYAAFVATRLKGRVRYYEVWNEWNGGMGGDRRRGGKEPENYVPLLKAVYASVKQVDPDATILGGAVEGAGDTSWIETLITRGGSDHMDGLSIHPYMHHKRRQGTPENLYRWLTRLEKKLSTMTAGRPLPIYITEIGWPTSNEDKGVSEETCAEYLARVYLLVWTLDTVKGIWWYELNDGGGESFGLIRVDGTPKPAFRVLRDIARLEATAVSAELVARGEGVWGVKLGYRDGRTTLALWSPDGGSRSATVEVSASGNETVMLRHLGEGETAGSTQQVQPGMNQLAVALGEMPLLLEVKSSSIQILRIVSDR